jgi:tetratricopeptide (TPR) repeat protein
MNELYLWLVTAVVTIVGLNTLVRLWSERERLWRDDLQEEDRAFAWRVVIFLIFPLLTITDLRATMVASQWLGGFIKHWSYGLFWYTAVPAGLPSENLFTPVLFAGALVQFALACCLLPALFFRPHPFLATIIGYTISFILALNLVIEPVISAVGLGGSRWSLFMETAPLNERILMVGIYATIAALYFMALSNRAVRLWFVDLSRPAIAEKLRDAEQSARHEPNNPFLLARVSVLFLSAGMTGEARRHARRLRFLVPDSLYVPFLQGMLSYYKHDFKAARKTFLEAAEFPHVDSQLKGILLAASACAAFAEGDSHIALNLAERALEFDEASIVARMVKVDVFLKSGRKEQAGEEILSAIRRGLDLNLDNKLPLDTEKVLQRINALEQVSEPTPTKKVPAMPF